MIRLGILEGSLRAGSLSRAAARAVPALVPDGLACMALPNPGSLPLFDQDVMDAGLPDSVADMFATAQSVDALLIVTPEYNWSVPGALKNALDWLSRPQSLPLAGKPVSIWSVSPGILGGARVHESLRQVLHSLDMRIMAKPEVQIASAKTRIDVAASRITDPATEAFLRDHLAAFQRFCHSMGSAAHRS